MVILLYVSYHVCAMSFDKILVITDAYVLTRLLTFNYYAIDFYARGQCLKIRFYHKIIRNRSYFLLRASLRN